MLTHAKLIYKNTKKSLNYLIKLENLNIEYEYTPTQILRMARAYYLIGDPKNAILYTKKLENRYPNNVSINFNKSFFAILEKNQKKLYLHLKKIYHKRRIVNTGIVDVISFLENEKSKHPDLTLYLEYTISFYTILFLDHEAGKRAMQVVLQTMQQQDYNDELIYFANKMINLH